MGIPAGPGEALRLRLLSFMRTLFVLRLELRELLACPSNRSPLCRGRGAWSVVRGGNLFAITGCCFSAVAVLSRPVGLSQGSLAFRGACRASAQFHTFRASEQRRQDSRLFALGVHAQTSPPHPCGDPSFPFHGMLRCVKRLHVCHCIVDVPFDASALLRISIGGS